MSLKYLPANFFQQFTKLRLLQITNWGLKKPEIDLFRGLVNVEFIRFSGQYPLPYLTDRVPKLTRLEINTLVEGNLAEINIRNLSALEEVRIYGSCNNIRLPAFQGAKHLTKYDASACAVRDMADLRHLAELATLILDMTQFECNSLTCWIVFEDLHNPALHWLNDDT